ncbi:hypothetical protein CASFOL_001986 [Castilleja foliolosa]|uniref:Uncharacterized protein n=1 Tax=Castilleja foliolosa TaxID=1961234 RepID=A0ABD3ECZ1_9LAMI
MDAATTEINASACETTVLQSANTSSSSSPPSSIAPAANDSFPTSVDQSPPTVAEDVSDHTSELLNRWSWVRLEFKEQRAVINCYVRLNHLAEIRSQLKKNHTAYTKFQGGCFGSGEFAVSTDDQCSVLFGEDNLKKPIPEWLWVLVEDEDKWENFPWGSYTFQILNLLEDSESAPYPVPEAKKFAYHFYGFCHAFAVHKECLETLEPTMEELIDYLWWSHVADDVRSHVQYVQRESPITDSNAGAPAASNAIVPADKMTQFVKEFMLRMRRDLTTTVEKMRQESANNLEKAKQDIADNVKDVRQENALIADNIVERITQNNAVSIEQANSGIKACMEQLRHNVMVRFQQMVPEPSNCNPTFDSAPDLPFVPFEDSFDEQLDAYTDPCDNKLEYVLSRGGNEALMTPIKIPLPATKELTPIKVDSDQLYSLLDPVVRFARPLRPTVAFKGSTFWMNKKQSKEMDAYRSFMASDSDEL